MRPDVFRLALAVLVAAATPAAARTVTTHSDVLGDVAILAPDDDDPKAFVVLISDREGLGAVRAHADSLVAAGAAVALIDVADLLAKQAAQDEDGCHYVFGTFEDLAKVAERDLSMATWRWPVLLGFGEGGTVAYLALAQAPENTAGGAVSVGFAPTLTMPGTFCPGAPVATATATATTYAPRPTLPAAWLYVASEAPAADVAPFVAAGGSSVAAPDPAAAGVAAALRLGAGPADSLSDLPLDELPATDPVALAVFISGDGGWRDLDKTIGENLSQHGVSVVGLDALRYFWSAKQPERVAADLDRIVAHYQGAWGTRKVALLGYSFGADIMPLVWPKLTEATRDDTVLLGLLGLGTFATLDVTVEGWLGLNPAGSIDLTPVVGALPKERVLCVYGRDEEGDGGTGCTLPGMAGATVIETDGGHHFDGDYDPIADRIRARIVAAP